MAARIATAAARAGSTVQLVGRVGDDAEGDALVLALAAAGVGHAALLRDSGHRTTVVRADVLDSADDPAPDEAATDAPAPPPADLDAADVDLGLRYLTDFDVLVVAADVPADAALAAALAAGWAGAQPILVVPPGAGPPAGSPVEAIVLEGPASDADAAFAELVGAYAAAVDQGETPERALRELATKLGWEPATDD